MSMRCTRRKHPGFTLIEVMVAMTAFTIIVMGTMQIMAQSTKSYRSQKSIQTNLESAQFALNLMAKELRTSSIINPGASSIVFFDYSQNRCIQYSIDTTAGTLSRRARAFTDANPDTNRTSCQTYSSFGFTETLQVLLSGITSHRLQIDASAPMPNPHVGRVSASLVVGTSGTSATVQTTVSLLSLIHI